MISGVVRSTTELLVCCRGVMVFRMVPRTVVVFSACTGPFNKGWMGVGSSTSGSTALGLGERLRVNLDRLLQ